MFRYVICILLVHSYDSSLGFPAPEAVTQSLSKVLIELGNSCENTFLAGQIKAKIKECDVEIPPYNEQQFQCLTFYDINKQLCDAVAASNVAIAGDQITKINEAINVGRLCSQTKDWVFTDIQSYPTYKETVGTVFTDEISCLKICGEKTVLSKETNFFCKYLKWGNEMLLSKPHEEVIIDIPVTRVPDIKKSAVKEPVLPSMTSGKDEIPSSSANVIKDEPSALPQPSKSTQVKTQEPSVPQDVKPVDVSTNQSSITSPNSFESVQSKPQSSELPPVREQLDPSAGQASEVVKPSGAEAEVEKAVELAKEVSEDKDVEEEKDIVEGKEKVPVDPLKNNISNNSDGLDSDDPDAEDGDGLADGDEDLGDPGLDTDVNRLINTNDINPKNVDTTKFSRDSYLSQYVDEDNDHFFSFFLTSVVLVVLFYVLYHNKSKVSKVVLGLIVEGRQPGRRRNSRGHAYKRLDTLEQAMSTNSTAPPSKIIY